MDMMHLYLAGHAFIPDTSFTIANILLEEGSSLGYLYDLGDNFRHEITVENILPTEEYTGKVEALDGGGACPPEDGSGNHTYNPKLQRFYAGDWNALNDVAEASNYRDDPATKRPGWRFEPERFEIDVVRKRIEVALQSKTSVPSGPKKFVMPIGGGTLEDILGRTRTGTRRVIENKGDGFVAETVADRPDRRGTAMCDNCGKPEGLKKCSGCSEVWYCDKV